MCRRLTCDVLRRLVTASAGIQSSLEHGAVDDDEAEEENRQSRNWPDHWGAIDVRASRPYPHNEV